MTWLLAPPVARISLGLMVIAVGLTYSISGWAKDILFLAAASTTDIMAEVSRSYRQQNKDVEARESKIRFSFAASSTLARQILNGVQADIYLSANQHWMTAIAKKGLLASDKPTPLLGNSLVMLSSRHNERIPGPASAANIRRLLAGRRLIIADPAHVPLGIYSKQSLESIGWWEALTPQLAYAASARAAVNLILRTGHPGIGYASDLKISKQLHVLHRFAEHLHEPIVYSLAVLRGRRRPAVVKFAIFLQSPAARRIYRKFNFRPLGQPSALPGKG